MAYSTGRTKNSVLSKTSRQVQGGLTDKYSNRLGWWERFPLERRSDDITYVISNEEDRRPDLIAKRVYSQTKLAWLVLQYNNIVDVETEFRTGTTIYLPTQERVIVEIMTQPAGGRNVT